ncbi:hypothetical protein KIPB_003986, partial [Kipferlia bialata]|eukprot:g3986.t1
MSEPPWNETGFEEWYRETNPVVADAVRECRSRGGRQLNLCHRDIGDTGAESLSRALPHLPVLKVLKLDHNKIGDAGVSALSLSLPHMALLTT